MNIEKTISEHAVSDILTPMLESQDRIVTEDVAPLFDQATGLDTPPASGTVTTTIEESRSVIIAIIRKAWTATLTMLGGASVIGYITAAYTYLRNRLQGNETYGIPDRRSEISASSPLAANLALLNDRKIGGADVADGMSLARILGSTVTITELTDDNVGWTWNKNLPTMPLTKLHLNCAYIVGVTAALPTTITSLRFDGLLGFGQNNEVRFAQFIYNNSNLTDLEFPIVQAIAPGFSYDTADENAFIASCANLKTVSMPELLQFGKPLDGHGTYQGNYGSLVHSCPELEQVLLPKWTGVRNWRIIRNCPKVWKVVLGDITSGVPSLYNSKAYPFDSCHKLRHLEFKSVNVSLDLSSWTPDSETLAHQDFLPNFRDYIAKRLKGGYPIGQGPILTLSQAVHNAINAAEDDYHIREIITQKGWTISPAPN